MIKKIFNYFSNPKRLVILNFILILSAITGNIYLQVFCIPTTWTIILLSICFINTATFPLISKVKWILNISSFFNGISMFIFLYCIIFLEQMNYIGFFAILFFGLGLLTFIPHYFTIQIFWKNILYPVTKISRLFFIGGIALPLMLSLLIGFEYKRQIHNFEKLETSDYENIEKGFMTEKILGMHFIYHTRLCEFDGWRPPKHEPILIIGMWFNNRIDPLEIELEDRIDLYKKIYPNRKTKFDCSCAWEYRNNYHNDILWK